jgi:hypothetical protein
MEAEKTHVDAEKKEQGNDGEDPEEPAPVKGFPFVPADG